MSTGETNGEVQDKLKRLINASGLGIEADIVHDNSGKAALQLTSMQTGLSETEDSLFSVAPSANAESISMMKQLGIDKVSSPAHNSDFSLNGTAHSSLSNTFTINNAFELTLKSQPQIQVPQPSVLRPIPMQLPTMCRLWLTHTIR